MPKLVKNCFNPHIGDKPFGEESNSINIQEIAVAIVFGNIFGEIVDEIVSKIAATDDQPNLRSNFPTPLEENLSNSDNMLNLHCSQQRAKCLS